MHIEDLKTFPLFSEELGIALNGHDDRVLFKWLLASVLWQADVAPEIAYRGFRTFERHHLLEPNRIVLAGAAFILHPVLHEAGYLRYDGFFARNLVDMCQTLQEFYQGSLVRLHDMATGPVDLECRLNALRGFNRPGVNLFLRELRTIWNKADPEPLPEVWQMAEKFSLDLHKVPRRSHEFVRLEAGLLRLHRGRFLRRRAQ